ncbi:MAG: ATP-binding protein, partial [Firmicutes bacterium]|nr:ATP-binding protein [Bacillota bacterium]
QIPLEQWHEALPDPTIADAILDRVIHSAHRIKLTGESMRKILAKPEQKELNNR